MIYLADSLEFDYGYASVTHVLLLCTDVAADLIYGADTGPSIAPSVFGTDNIPELPEIVLDQPPGVPDPTRSDTTPTQSNAPPPPPPPSNAPPPPPPPPPPPASAGCKLI